MSLTRTFEIGSLRCHTLEAGRQRLDGGAMFGVVPKPLWSRRMPADDRNRIPLALRCLLVEHPDGLVLIDTGVGNKEDEKFRDMYGIENDGTAGPTQLEDALAEVGFGPDDVAWVINTHLHFDHAGGNTYREPGSAQPLLAFPRATHIVQRGELDFARHTNERTRGSYFSDNFEPVEQAGRWQLVDQAADILPGITLRLTPGHVPYHQSVLVADAGDASLFLADLIPTSAHLPLPWIMGYDVEPLRTLETKRAILAEAAEQGWRLVFEHDPEVLWGRARADGARVVLDEVQSVADGSAGPGGPRGS
ncbi:MAG: MBL fold metallo-hydrolase [Gemmatimonadales bacterium]|nr:MAG: MBL fold metallo-hydrolase [Gemmatimonadales bacterium]